MRRGAVIIIFIAALILFGAAFLYINDPARWFSNEGAQSIPGETVKSTSAPETADLATAAGETQSAASQPRRVETQILGTVITEDGAPAAGALIYIFSDTDKPELTSPLIAPPAPRPHVIKTNTAGEFTIKNNRGAVVAAAHLESYGWGFTKLEGETVKIQIDRAKPIRLQARNLITNPVSGARVKLTRLPFSAVADSPKSYVESDPFKQLLSNVEHYEFAPDAGGDYTLEGASEGLYFVEGEAPGFVSFEAQYGLLPGNPVILVFDKPATARGTVADAETGAPIAGATLQMIDPDGEGAWMSKKTATNAAGQYELVSPCGRYLKPIVNLRAIAPGYASELKRVDNFKAGADVKINVFLTKAATIAGSVVNTNGEPIDRAEVQLHIKESGIFDDTKFTNLDGQFTFKDAARGREYTLFASAVGYESTSIVVKATGDPVPPIVLTPSGLLIFVIDGAEKLTLPAKAFVYVRLDALLSGEPSAGWKKSEVELKAESKVPVSPPGEYTAFLAADGFAPAASAKVKIEAGRESEASFTLTKGVPVRGRVIWSKDKSPIPGAEIRIHLPPCKGDPYGIATNKVILTDAAGRFTYPNCSVGDVFISAIAGYGAEGFINVSVSNRENFDVGDIEIRRLSKIRGKVNWDVVPSPLPQACIYHMDRLLAYVDVDSMGAFVFEYVAESEYVIRLRDRAEDSTLVGHATVSVSDGDDVLVEFDYGTATIDGAVLRGGEPAGGKWKINVRPTGSRELVATKKANDNGEFRLSGLRPREYVVEAALRGKDRLSLVSKICDLKSGENRVDLAASGSEVTFAVRRGAGEPIEGATLYYRLVDTSMSAHHRLGETGAGGLLSIGDMRPGTYQFMCVRGGFATAFSGAVRVEDGKRAEVKLTLEKESIVNVTVRDAGGAPRGGARVQYRSLSNPNHRGSLTAADGGGARVPGLSAGDHEFTITADGLFPSAQTVAVGAQSEQALSVTLSPVGSLKIVARAPNGAPLGDAEIEILTKSGDACASDWLARGWIRAPGGSLITNNAGELLVEGLPACELVITVQGGAPRSVTLKANDTGEVAVVGGP